MDFKTKLTFLPAPASANASAGHAGLLGQLREKMAEILDSSGVLPSPLLKPAADPSQTALPFVREETPHGTIYRQHRIVPPSHRVGRIPVDSARSSSAELLALLALDPRLAGANLTRALYFDTETTGLGGSGALAFLLGLAWFDEQQQLHLEQLLLRSPADEPALLAVLRERLLAAELLVSYNGKAFDWPLLKGRFVMNHLKTPEELPHLDLLHVGRRLHRARISGCRLATLESEVLGFVRGADIDGADVPARYAHFLRTGDEEALLQVVEHNAWDVLSMAALVGLYGEPFDLLHGEDLVGFATTMKRAGALALAERAADRALTLGVQRALRVRGDVHKARGDRARALLDFEALAAGVDDPSLRLELAKLYEHFVKDPARALSILGQGTSENELKAQKRRQRLERKALPRPDSTPPSPAGRDPEPPKIAKKAP